MNKSTVKVRSVATVQNSLETHDGNGVPLRRLFPNITVDQVDPFLLFDHLGPIDLPAGSAIGFPDHPHRGFETVTYVLEGQFQHKDSQGNSGVIGPGDVQWMTAGSGVVHSEMPEEKFAQEGGRLHGFQLWVNLPRKDKMIPPRYQDLRSANIPRATSDNHTVEAKVIAGESSGLKAQTQTRTPITYLHLILEPGAQVIQPIARSHNCFSYVIEGSGLFGSSLESASAGQGVLFQGDAGDILIVSPYASKVPLSVLVIAGEPLNEPVARLGPFVMNSQEEIAQALKDYQEGRMGQIAV